MFESDGTARDKSLCCENSLGKSIMGGDNQTLVSEKNIIPKKYRKKEDTKKKKRGKI